MEGEECWVVGNADLLDISSVALTQPAQLSNVDELGRNRKYGTGHLCGARRPIGLICDRLRLLVNRSPRQRAAFSAS
ncbi:hypothetical protein INR49_023527 [Caranx melampygus]|nr:hypothetical protein INR49_023527 [Caranx melampygus]